jgi:hypothetical protein
MEPVLHSGSVRAQSRKKITPSTREASQTGMEINVNPDLSLPGFGITVKRYG